MTENRKRDKQMRQTEATGDEKHTGALMGEDSREEAKEEKAWRSSDRKTKRASVMHGEEEGG